MTQILINGRFLAQATTGVQRYAIELTRALDELVVDGSIPASYQLRMLVPPNAVRDPGFRRIEVEAIGRLSGQAWEQIELAKRARGTLLFNPCNTAPLAATPVVVTIHDAAVFATPGAYSTAFRTWYQLAHRRLGRTARGVITDSEFSKSELQQYCNTPAARIHVVPLAADHMAAMQADHAVFERKGVGSKPYVLSVSSLNPNKNFSAVAQAVYCLGDLADSVDFLVAGASNSRIFAGTPVEGASRLRYLGYVSDSELKALYQRAVCFVYPSLYEGFGLPPLEAMACGCPVIVSRAASLPGVCGDAALYCDPHDPADLARQIRRLIGDVDMQQDLRAKGLARAAEFSWRRCAVDTFEVLKRLAG